MNPENFDKAVLVTGAARRIGAEIARGLHGAGYRVIVHCHRSVAEAEALVADLNERRPDSARLVRADLAETVGLAGLVDRAAGFWGRLDGLVNNASTFYPTPLETVAEKQWDELMASNLKAPFFLAQAAAAHLRRQRGGIVNIVDIYAERPLRSFPVYSIAKAGLAALTRSLAVELASEVRVNGVAPGAILWPEQEQQASPKAEILARVALGHAGEPSDIVKAVLFLLGEAPYMTGQILAVDGGRSLFI
ncbi:pteridine reductase [Methylomagnum sp.]